MGMVTNIVAIAILATSIWAWKDSDSSISARGYSLVFLVALVGIPMMIYFEFINSNSFGSGSLLSAFLLFIAVVGAPMIFIADIIRKHPEESATVTAVGGAAIAKHQEKKRKKESKRKRIRYTQKCPECDARWNVNTGRNVNRFSKAKLQCDVCSHVEYVGREEYPMDN